MIPKNLTTFKINKLTKAQYEAAKTAGTLSEEELYMTPEEVVDLSDCLSSDYTATLSTTWDGTAALYTQDVAINGITETDTPIIDLVVSTTEWDAQEGEWGKIVKAETYNGGIKFYAKEKTTINLSVNVKVVK